MAVNGISMGKMDWTNALSALNAIKGVKAVKDGDVIRITRAGSDKTLTLRIPDLDSPDVFSPAELENLIKQFDDFRNKGDLPTTDAERLTFVNALKNAFSKVLETDPVAVDDLLGTGPKRGASKSLFDVYAIFKLLITVAQLQRNALRDVRQAENAAVQKAILDQAAEQRSAALAGLIGAVAVCGLQLTAQLTMAGVKVAAAKIVNKIKAAAGVDAAKVNLKTSQLADDPATAAKNLKNLGKDLGFDKNGNSIRQQINEKLGLGTGTEGEPLGDKTIGDLNNKIEGLNEKIEGHNNKIGELDEKIARQEKELENLGEKSGKIDGDIDNQRREVNKLKYESGKLGEIKDLEKDKSELADRQTELQKEFETASEEKKKELRPQLDDCEKKLADVERKIKLKEDLDGKDGNGGQIKQAEDKLKGLQDEGEKLKNNKAELEKQKTNDTSARDKLVGERDEANKELSKSLENRKTAQEKVCKSVDGVEQEYKQKFEEASAEYRGALKTGDEAAIEKAKTNFEQAQKEYEYVHAAGIESKIGNAEIPREEVAKQYLQQDIEQLDGAEKRFMADPDYAKYEQDKARYNVIDSVIQSMGQMLQQVAQQISQIKQAKAHTVGVKEQEARNELDQVNDLFANCQKLMEAVLQAMMAVVQAESQSIDNAIQGLRG